MVQPAEDSVRLLDQAEAVDVEGLYAHVPFCFHKCHYCDFYSIVDDGARQVQFTDRLSGELQALGRRVGRPLASIFVGGGTPTLLAAPLWRRLLGTIDGAFDLADRLEFTVEANPETLTDELLGALVEGGVNRLSIGAQSFDPGHLKTLQRWHDPANVDRAVALARAAGIGEINLDLIFGIPGQSVEDWRADLDRAVALGPTHLACYGLTYEPGTAMTRKLELGRIDPAEESVEAAMYEATIERLAEAGFVHYEISNWAKAEGEADHRCRHNLMYWRNGSWLAAGPSASGHVAGLRWKHRPHLGRYLSWPGAGAPIEPGSVERLDAAASIGEQLMLRLRLREGAPASWLAANLDADRAERIERQVELGLLERVEGAVRLTRRGLLIADSVMAELL